MNKVSERLSFALLAVFILTGFGMEDQYRLGDIIGVELSTKIHTSEFLAWTLVASVAVHTLLRARKAFSRWGSGVKSEGFPVSVNRFCSWLLLLFVVVFVSTGFGILGEYGFDRIIGLERCEWFHTTSYLVWPMIVVFVVHSGFCLTSAFGVSCHGRK